MYQVDFNTPVNAFFIGIGGISMSGLAEILIDRGFHISGSDMRSSHITDHLKSLGATIHIGQKTENLNKNNTFIVYTAAIKEDNPEFQAGKALGIPMIDRATLLGQVMDHYKYSVGVAGTHGKTTTTSMVAHVLDACKCDPTVSVGGILKLIEGNIKVGKSDYFVTEACEYANSFFKFKPYIGIILNIEEDHMDFFTDLEHIRRSFRTYLDNIPSTGYGIIHKEILSDTAMYDDVACQLITYGFESEKPEYYPANITYNEMGCGSYDLMHKDQVLTHITLSSTGAHNVLNSVAVMAMAHLLGLDLTLSAIGISQFSGADRRFEYKGDLRGVTIIDDYAHHPTEIDVTIETARKIAKNNLWVVFQPHTYTRTKAFLDDFGLSLSKADGIIVTDIYAAREKDDHSVHATDVVEIIKRYNDNAYYIQDFDSVQNFLLTKVVQKDMLITMGAGDVYLIGESLLNN